MTLPPPLKPRARYKKKRKLTPEDRAARSLAAKERAARPEVRAQLLKNLRPLRAGDHTDEIRAKMSKANRGRKDSEEAKANKKAAYALRMHKHWVHMLEFYL